MSRPARPPLELSAVHGIALDPQTRCVHYHGPTDIVAIRFHCCDTYYACKDCHEALAGHAIQVWPRKQWSVEAIRCGACGREMTIRAYLDSAATCPACAAAFNPRCGHHHRYYFASTAAARTT